MSRLKPPTILVRRLRTADGRRLLERAGVPSDPRGIILGCGFAAAAGIGAIGLTDGDPLGWAYLAGAAAGYLFLQTRLVPTSLWLVVVVAGLWAAWAGAPAGWVQAFYGLVLAAVAVIPVAETGDLKPQPILNRTSTLVEESPPNHSIVISSIGRFQILVAAQDLTPRILDKRTIGGLWCYLLALAARSSPGSISRTVLATQLSPGIPRRQQRERLRRQLWDLQHDLGPELGGLVIADRSTVGLDLSRVEFDVLRLQELCAELRSKLGTTIEGDLLTDVVRMLDETANHQFLPDFERLAADAGIDIVIAKRTVAEVRSKSTYLREELARLLAEQNAASRKDSSRRSGAALKGDIA